jgi:hypothetical protein
LPDITHDEFTRRFIDHMIRNAGFTHFDDGTAVAAYAEEAAETAWLSAVQDNHCDTPEDCAESDMDYWGED